MDLLTASVLYRESSGTPYTLVVLAGELDATNSPQLRDLLESEISAGLRTLIVELSGLKEAVGWLWTGGGLYGELVLVAVVFWLVSRGSGWLRGWRAVSGHAGGPAARELAGAGLRAVLAAVLRAGQAAAGAGVAVAAVRAWRASRLPRAVMALRMLWLAAQRASSASTRLPR
jgi:hypothetical protein